MEMLVFRKIWRGFALIHDSAPDQARKNATFAWWIRWNYARAMGSAIRRQVDVREDVVSLGRLIDRVWRYPTVLTRERFHANPGQGSSIAEGNFEALAGEGDFINPEIPAQDAEDLRTKTATVRGWVNKAVAHADAKGRDAPPLEEVHASIDAIFELFSKYYTLVHGPVVGGDVLMSNWPVVFRVPWIPDEQWVTISQAVSEIGREPPPQF